MIAPIADADGVRVHPPLHPRDNLTGLQLPEIAAGLGMLPEIAAGLGMLPERRSADILRSGTDDLFLTRALTRFRVRSEVTVLLQHVVSDDRLTAARERRHAVFAIGLDRLVEEEFRGGVADYLAHRNRILAGLVSMI